MTTQQARQKIKSLASELLGVAIDIGNELDSVEALRWEIDSLRAKNERLLKELNRRKYLLAENTQIIAKPDPKDKPKKNPKDLPPKPLKQVEKAHRLELGNFENNPFLKDDNDEEDGK